MTVCRQKGSVSNHISNLIPKPPPPTKHTEMLAEIQEVLFKCIAEAIRKEILMVKNFQFQKETKNQSKLANFTHL